MHTCIFSWKHIILDVLSERERVIGTLIQSCDNQDSIKYIADEVYTIKLLSLIHNLEKGFKTHNQMHPG